MSVVKSQSVARGENSSVVLTITVNGQATTDKYSELLKRYAKEAVIKGFRKGHAPVNLLEKKYGEAIANESFYNVLEDAVKEALDSVKEKPLHTAIPKLLNEEKLTPALNEDFTFSVQYDTFPEVKLAPYSNIDIELPTSEVDSDAINEELKRIQEQNAMMIDKANGKVEKGDSVTVNYVELTEDDSEVEKTKGEGFTFTVGNGYSPYKVDEDVIGMQKDSEKVFTKSYSEEETDAKLKGRSNVKVKVKVTAIKQKDIPALNDELAQDVSEKFKTLDDLKADVKSRLSDALENRKKELTTEKILEKLIEGSTMEIPESMIEAELQNQLANLGRQMGMGAEQIKQIFARDEESTKKMMEEWRPNAIKSIKQSLILNEIIDKEKIEVSDADLEAEYEKLAKASGATAAEVKEYYVAQNAQIYLKSDIQTNKAIELLSSNAKIKNGKKLSYVDFMKRN